MSDDSNNSDTATDGTGTASCDILKAVGIETTWASFTIGDYWKLCKHVQDKKIAWCQVRDRLAELAGQDWSLMRPAALSRTTASMHLA